MENLETENKFEGLYIIGYGLSGGFGGARNFEVIQADNQEEAYKWAWESACQEYENYSGMHGLRDVSQIMEEDDIEDEDEEYENTVETIQKLVDNQIEVRKLMLKEIVILGSSIVC